jgi:type IV pilus assembly protein PilN
MSSINLLPWRDELRRERKRAFLGHLALTALLGVIALALWIYLVDLRIETQQARNGLLSREIAAMDAQVKEIHELKKRREQVLARMRVIQDLQANRPDIVRVFDELVRVIPPGVYLESLSREGDNISLVGYAESNNRISAFMRSLGSSAKFQEPNLTQVTADHRLGEQGNRFDLRVKVTKPGSATEGG